MKSPWLPTGIGQAKTGFQQEAGREVVVVRREEPLLARNGVDEIGDEPLGRVLEDTPLRHSRGQGRTKRKWESGRVERM